MALSFLALFFTGTAFAHDAAPDWIRDLRNGENGKCCGPDDCTPVSSILILGTDQQTIRILIDGRTMTQIRRTSFVPISCDKRPHVCLLKSVEQDDKLIHCWQKKDDGSLEIAPLARCFRCVLMPYCPS